MVSRFGKKFFEKMIDSEYPVIFYESPHRIVKTLEELKDIDQELKIVICRELTKKFESIYRGSIKVIVDELKKSPIKGEFVVVVKRTSQRDKQIR